VPASRLGIRPPRDCRGSAPSRIDGALNPELAKITHDCHHLKKSFPEHTAGKALFFREWPQRGSEKAGAARRPPPGKVRAGRRAGIRPAEPISSGALLYSLARAIRTEARRQLVRRGSGLLAAPRSFAAESSDSSGAAAPACWQSTDQNALPRGFWRTSGSNAREPRAAHSARPSEAPAAAPSGDEPARGAATTPRVSISDTSLFKSGRGCARRKTARARRDLSPSRGRARLAWQAGLHERAAAARARREITPERRGEGQKFLLRCATGPQRGRGAGGSVGDRLAVPPRKSEKSASASS